MPESVAAILLAAGRSRRMGAFKPLLPFGDRTVVEASIQALLAAGIAPIVIVLGTRADEMKERLAHLPISFAFNRVMESEMSASIARGVEQVPHTASALLIALADQPAIEPEAIRHLVSERERTGATLLVPEHEGRGGHPVLIDLKYRDELLGLDPLRGLRGFFEAHRAEVLRVPVASPYVARDMDTWDDYRTLHLEIFGFEPPPASSSS